ncbi:hypothetical protein SPRG_19724 [Saprolegnia parasitica CBS 223.65]|uniref:F-box domain-containing protein n=1 Tax=Saprolegnia parasitica (strain CBS 223.65) TaxID=695850 RepID=A0A067CSR6_SAPPC|nr:hypothetical protein SPRG_19724 [Saprolegnia parasitica CBS 223.65]KDO29842.1 hypothetical protein SPRG_19724 [Saprolegnia parasitica CBS 223.65]|eukprot:XP_012199543.1 hypothetical protein SPRG_19724 [Saprolegnia parasitica CBS 223.65]
MLAALPRDVGLVVLTSLGPTADALHVALVSRGLRATVLAYAAGLTDVVFQSCTPRDAARVAFFLCHAKGLARLSFRASHRLVTDAFLATMAPLLGALTSLSLAYCTELTSVAALRSCVSLQELDLAGCSKLRTLGFALPSLRVLRCAWCRRLTANEIIQTKLAITELDLTGWDVHDIEVQLALVLRAIHTIEALSLVNVPLSESGLFVVFNLAAKLRRLALSKKSANVWVDGTWQLTTLQAWMRRRPCIDVTLV